MHATKDHLDLQYNTLFALHQIIAVFLPWKIHQLFNLNVKSILGKKLHS